MNSDARLAAIRERLEREKAAALIVTRSTNVTYVTGMDGIDDEEDPHVVVITRGEAILYTDSRYDEVARGQAIGTPWQVRRPEYPYVASVSADIAQLVAGVDGAVLIEDSVPHRSYLEWEAKLSPLTVAASDGWVERVRVVKDAGEIERIARAQSIADEAWAYLLGWMQAGRTEREAAMELDFAMRRLGADTVGFPTIVASGPNGSRPHAVPGDRAFQRGDLVTFDFGAKVGGYHSDMTRTIAVGELSDAHAQMYETVRVANQAGINAVRAGVAGAAVDRAARDVIEGAGMGEHFGHGTGHGVGLAIHEFPYVSPRSEWTLEAGMVVTVEPGIYVPEDAGVRIEDLVVVTAEGSRVLSVAPRDLHVVDR